MEISNKILFYLIISIAIRAILWSTTSFSIFLYLIIIDFCVGNLIKSFLHGINKYQYMFIGSFTVFTGLMVVSHYLYNDLYNYQIINFFIMDLLVGLFATYSNIKKDIEKIT